MPSPQKSQSGTPLPARPTIPTGRELYDQIMGHIEPELTTEGRKILGEKYKVETSEQKQKRAVRYKIAFERCAKACDEYLVTLRVQADRYVRVRREHLESKDRALDESSFDETFGGIYQLS